MSGFYLNIALGFVIATVLFGAVIALVAWLYRMAFGYAPRLPAAGFSSGSGIALMVLFAGALAGGGIYLYTVARADWAFWDAYTLPKQQVIDYVLASLTLMPSLFWFGYSLFAPSGAAGGAASGEGGPDEATEAEAELERELEPEPSAAIHPSEESAEPS